MNHDEEALNGDDTLADRRQRTTHEPSLPQEYGPHSLDLTGSFPAGQNRVSTHSAGQGKARGRSPSAHRLTHSIRQMFGCSREGMKGYGGVKTETVTPPRLYFST